MPLRLSLLRVWSWGSGAAACAGVPSLIREHRGSGGAARERGGTWEHRCVLTAPWQPELRAAASRRAGVPLVRGDLGHLRNSCG